MYLLDTNVVSELRQGKPAQSAAVRAWAASVPINQLFLSAISVLELEKGVQALEHRTPPQGNALRHWLDGLKIAFTGRILPFTEHTATLCAAMHIPNPKSERDAMIAASALAHGFIIVTRNVADFKYTGVQVFDPWDDVRL